MYPPPAASAAPRSPSTYLLVIGHREALAWVLANGRMAFPDFTRRETRALIVGDSLMIYTTRTCFRNPQRDRGRVIGEATVTSPVTQLDPLVRLAERTFPVGCEVSVHGLAPMGEGVCLAPLVDVLDAFPKPAAWAARLRRPLLSLGAHDARVLRDGLAPMLRDPREVLDAYLRWLPPN